MEKTKGFSCFILAFSLLFFMVPTAFAADEDASDSASYVDSDTGDLMTVEVVATTPSAVAQEYFLNTKNIYVTRILRNGVFEELLYVDIKNDTLTHEYSDGAVAVQTLSDIVTVTEVEPSLDDWGFMLSNSQMIEIAIDSYLETLR